MRLITHFCISKTGRIHDNEDHWTATDNFVAVADGATSQTSRKWNGDKTGGLVASKAICDAVHDLPKDATPEQIVGLFTSRLKQLYEQEGMDEDHVSNHPEERASASFVLYSRHRQEVVMVGDCQVAFVTCNDKGENIITKSFQHNKKIDGIASRARAAFLASELTDGKGVQQLQHLDTGRAFIKELLVRMKRFQNNPKAPDGFRYWVLDGTNVAQEGIFVHPVPPDVTSLVLASDGYTKLFPSLLETERHLERLLEEDPLMIMEYPATKGVQKGAVSYDDRCFVKVSIH